MVTNVSYIPLTVDAFPVAFCRFLLCRNTRPTIMSVRMTLRESEIEKYGMAMLRPRTDEYGCMSWMLHKMANTASVMSALPSTHVELVHVPKVERYIKQGKATTQKFME